MSTYGDHGPGGGSQAGAALEPLWCPQCSAQWAPADDDRSCRSCGLAASHEDVVSFSEAWADAWRALVRTEDLQGRYRRLTRQAAEIHEQWRDAVADLERAQSRVVLMRAAAVGGQPAAPAPEHAATPVSAAAVTRRPRPAIPTPLLLQGVGAVLLLAALVVASAVLWKSMPPWVQLAVLGAGVAMVAGLTIATRRYVPTTSMVLAALTVGGGVVVTGSVPALFPQIQPMWFAPAAAIAGAAVLIAMGAAGRVRLWRHAGLVLVPVSAVLLIVAVMSEVGAESDTVQWWSTLAMLTSAVALAFLGAAAAARRGDRATAATARWSAALLVIGAVFAQGIAMVPLLAHAGEWTMAERIQWAGAAVVVVLPLAAAHRLQRHAALPGDVQPLPIAAAIATVVPVVAFTPMPVTTTASALLAAAPLLLVLLALALVAWRVADRSSLVPVLAAGAVSAAAVGTLVQFGMMVDAPEEVLWAMLLATGAAIASPAILFGLLVASTLWTAFGVAVAAATWAAVWVQGRLGEPFEWATLPILALALAAWAGLSWRRGWPRGDDLLVPQMMILIAVVPSILAGWVGHVEGTAMPWRYLVVGVLLATALLISAVSRVPWTPPVVAVVAAGLGHAVIAIGEVSDPAVEYWTGLAAIAAAAVLAAGVADGWASLRLAWSAPTLIVLVPSSLVAVTETVGRGQVADDVRVILVLLVWALATAVFWRRPNSTLITGGVGLFVAWANTVSLITERYEPPLEVWTAITALAVGLWLTLAARAAGREGSWLASVEPARTRLAAVVVPILIVLIPSSILAMQEPMGDGEVSTAVRAVAVVAAWAVGTAWQWRAPGVAAATAAAGLLVGWVNTMSVLDARVVDPAPEVFTLPSAAFVLLLSLLVTRSMTTQVNSLLRIGPAVAVAVLPTAALAWSDGEAGIRVWATLTACGAMVLLGVWREWAGLVYPALLGLAMVVAPVLVRTVQDLPAWVPLSLVGLALFLVGVRLESVRRRGDQFTHWMAHLH